MGKPDFTGLLRQLAQGGGHDALDRLIPIVYEELRRTAHGQVRYERPGHTLSTTALVNETYLRLVKVDQVQWQDRAHFFAVASRLMRRVLIDYARARGRAKRGGHTVRLPLDSALDMPAAQAQDLIELDDALTVKRDWTFSRAWLNRELERASDTQRQRDRPPDGR